MATGVNGAAGTKASSSSRCSNCHSRGSLIGPLGSPINTPDLAGSERGNTPAGTARGNTSLVGITANMVASNIQAIFARNTAGLPATASSYAAAMTAMAQLEMGGVLQWPQFG